MDHTKNPAHLNHNLTDLGGVTLAELHRRAGWDYNLTTCMVIDALIADSLQK